MNTEEKEKNKKPELNSEKSHESEKVIKKDSKSHESEKVSKKDFKSHESEKVSKKDFKSHESEKVRKKDKENEELNDKVLIDKKELEKLKIKVELTRECLETTLKDNDKTIKDKDFEIKELNIKVSILAIIFVCFAFLIKTYLPESVQESIYSICNKSFIISIILLVAAIYYLELNSNSIILITGTFIVQIFGVGSSLFKKI
jgi:hypothetical protein